MIKTNNNEKGKACDTYGEQSKCIQNFGGKREGKRQFAKPRRTWSIILNEILKTSGGRA